MDLILRGINETPIKSKQKNLDSILKQFSKHFSLPANILEMKDIQIQPSLTDWRDNVGP